MKEIFKDIKIEDLDALLIMQKVLQKDKLRILTEPIKLTFFKKKRIINLARKREKGMPLAYVLGETEFMGLPFFVNMNVLIPRCDTECLVQEVIKHSKGSSVLEIGVGSGAVSISIAKFGEPDLVCGIDISKKALKVARKNAKLNEASIEFIQADILADNNFNKFDIIVSNPPYIPTKIIGTLQTEVKDYEPKLALDGSEDGLKFYRRIAEKAKDMLNPGGMIFFEIGDGQEQDVVEIMKDYKFLGNAKDLSGTVRVLKFSV